MKVFLDCGFRGLLVNGFLFKIFLFVKGLFISLKGLFVGNVVKELFLKGFLLLNIFFFLLGVNCVNIFWFFNFDGKILEGIFVELKGLILIFFLLDFWGKLKFVKKFLLKGLERFLFFFVEEIFIELGYDVV